MHTHLKPNVKLQLWRLGYGDGVAQRVPQQTWARSDKYMSGWHTGSGR